MGKAPESWEGRARARLGGSICGQVQEGLRAPGRCWQFQLVGLALLPKEEFLAVSSHRPFQCQAAIKHGKPTSRKQI